jgi:hypothetical protein
MSKLSEFDAKPAIQQVRAMVRAFSYCRESFLEQFTLDELRALYRAWLACEWDFFPDRWSREQVLAALGGTVPTFRDDGTPAHG